MIKLYPHQEKFIDDIRFAFKTNRSVLAQAPVGFGKTIISAYMGKRILEKKTSLFFTVHRKDLIVQTQRTFQKFEIPFMIIAAGYSHNPSPIQICSINTLQNRLTKYPTPSIVILDEAHHSSAKGWAKVVKYYRERGAYILGLSASPWRLNGEGLKDHFDTMVKGPSMRWLIDNGFLSKYRMFAPSRPSLSGTHVRMGEYVQSEIEDIMDKPSITGDAVEHYKRHALNKKTICFCVSIAHSKHTAEMFNQNGVSAAHLDGECSNEYRQKVITDFAAGRVNVITNCGLFSEGFDLSLQSQQDITVEAVILLRPTKSLALYIQMTGRGLRKKPDPAIILDHANCVMEHGLPDDDRDWTLDGSPKKSKSEKTVAVKICPMCYAALPASISTCECGHVFEVNSRDIAHVAGDLDEIDIEAMRQAKINEAVFKSDNGNELLRAQTREQLFELAKRRGYKNPWGWAHMILQSRQRKKLSGI